MIRKQTRTVIRTWICFFSIFFQVCLYALPQAEDIRFRRISIEEGLSQVSINCILQDSKGFMWFGTQDGLNRFDGYEFEVYRNKPNEPSLSSDNVWVICEDKQDPEILWVGTDGGGLNRFDRKREEFIRYSFKPEGGESEGFDEVRCILEDDTGILWIGTFGGGLFKYVKETGIFTRYSYLSAPAGNGLSSDKILSICKARDGDLWIGTDNGGLNRFNPESGEFSHFTTDEGLCHNRVWAIMEDADHMLWIGTANGVTRYDPYKKEFLPKQTIKDDETSLSDNDVRVVFQDKQGRIWLGTRGGGLNLYLPETDNFIRFVHRTRSDSLSHNDVRSIHQDTSGGLWIGTRGGGLNMYNPHSFHFRHYRHEAGRPDSLSHDMVLSFYEDRMGYLWIGTYGGGLNRWDRKTGQFRHYKNDKTDPDSLSKNIIWSIQEDYKNRLWVATVSGGLDVLVDREKGVFKHYKHDQHDENSLSSDESRCVFEDNQHVLWVGTFGGGLNEMISSEGNGKFKVYKPVPGDINSLSGERVVCILQDHNDDLWFGTRNEGLNKLVHREKGIFERYTVKSHKLSHNSIHCIYESTKGVLWVGTDEGLNRFDRQKNEFKAYGKKHGQANDVVYAIQEDKLGNLWISTNYGLSRFDPDKEEFRNFDIYDGTQSNEFNQGASWKDKKGVIFFGGINGFNGFLPKKIYKSHYEPPVVITKFLLFNQPVKLKSVKADSPLEFQIHETQALTLTHKQGVFSFEFAALAYTGPQKNRYQYRLTGYDNEWLTTEADRRHATYTSLPSGDYTFQVKGSNKDGVWNKIATSIRIKILPPWWKSWWAYILYVAGGILVVLILLYALYQNKVVHKMKQYDRLKNEFLSNTSQELRTPLNGIIGLAQTLMGQMETLTPKFKSNLHLIISYGHRLSSLVNDILDYSQMKHGSLMLKKNPVSLYAIIEEVIILSRPFVGEKNLLLSNRVGKETAPVNADENRLRQILHNLVGNAIKFTESGTITISAEVKDHKAFIRIKDTGIGIPMDKHQDIFRSFEQVDGGIDRKYEGTGLGLAITRSLVELHGGTITVDSDAGGGASFTFSIPVWKKKLTREVGKVFRQLPQEFLPPLDWTNVYQKVEISSQGDYHILIVADDPLNLHVVYNFFDKRKYTVTEASGGVEALKKLDLDQPVHLVVLDLMMPGMTGYEVCRKIREGFAAHELPIIFLTARSREKDILEAFEVGANDYVSKPVSRDELIARVDIHINLMEANRRLKKEQEKLKNTQEQLIHAEKMSSLGRLVSGVAHELNNPASYIRMNADHFKKVWDEIIPILDNYAETNPDFEITELPFNEAREEVNELIKGLMEGADRVKKIVGDLRDYSRKETKRETVNVNKVVHAAMRLLNNKIKSATDNFQTLLDKNIPDIQGYSQRLEQVVINLLENACEALPNKSCAIRVTTKYDTRKKMVIIGVTDEGEGIARENLKYVMEPFFTTKRDSGGLGLGMSISYTIIKSHGGRIDVDSKIKKGTSVLISLPLNFNDGNGDEIKEINP